MTNIRANLGSMGCESTWLWGWIVTWNEGGGECDAIKIPPQTRLRTSRGTTWLTDRFGFGDQSKL